MMGLIGDTTHLELEFGHRPIIPQLAFDESVEGDGMAGLVGHVRFHQVSEP